MDFSLSGAVFVRATRNDTWAALHDVDVISSCIPGCRSLVRVSDRAYDLGLKAQLGPLRIALIGTIEVARSDPPSSYCLVGHGRGDMGRARGRAEIDIAEASGGCLLSYRVNADTHGALCSAGPYVLAAFGKALAMFFAKRFSETVSGRRSRVRPTFQRV